MNSRRIVLDTLEMRRHGRALRDLWTLPWATKRYGGEIDALCRDFPMDFVSTPGFFREPCPGHGDPYAPGICTDDWGCEFANIHEGVISDAKNPQVMDDEWDDVDKVRIPRHQLRVDIEKINDFVCATPEMFHTGGGCPRPFEQLQFIRGTVNFYMDLMDPPPKMLAFIRETHAFYCE